MSSSMKGDCLHNMRNVELSANTRTHSQNLITAVFECFATQTQISNNQTENNIICTYYLLAVILLFSTGCQFSPFIAPSTATMSFIVAADDSQNNGKITALQSSETEKKIPLDNNKYVKLWIDYFTNKDRERLERFLARGQQYKEIVQNTLQENDLPEELYYLAMIESGFQTHAKSTAQAIGVWQFISGTAARYGLRIDHYVDERKDPIRSTEAAAKYLRDLYNVFGSWHLAMAAYNAGEIRILRAVFKARTRNFWGLVESKVLPRETAEYVPKIIAMILIAQNPVKYSLQIEKNILNYPNLKAIEVPGSLSLANLAKIAEIDVDLLIKVNPHLKQYRTPSNSAKYEVWIPVEFADKAQTSYANLESYAPNAIGNKPIPEKTYTVKKGDTLLRVANRHKISIGHLKRINRLKSNKIVPGIKLLTFTSVYTTRSRPKTYQVRRGDNLTAIANKFKITVDEIKTKNKLIRNNIFAGQIIKI